MKRLIRATAIFACVAYVCLVGACGGDDDPAEPPLPDCSITITQPAVGAMLMAGEGVNVRWDAVGGGRVRLALMQAGTELGEIAETDNDGYFRWTASTLGGPSGADFAIVANGVADAACGDTLGPLEIIDAANCGISPFVREERVVAGEDLLIRWDAANTSGLVDIDLYYGPLEGSFIGPIAASTPDDGEFLWEGVDSFHHGTGELYFVRISDARIPTCWGTTDHTFTMVDEDICWIVVQTPTHHSAHEEGASVDIAFTPFRTTGHVDLRLYAGLGTPLDFIARRVPVADPVVRWTIEVDDSHPGPDNVYRVLVTDSEDPFCRGFSPQFFINRVP